MHEQDKAILKSLVSVAWADGTFELREHQMLDALIESFGASKAEADEIRDYAKSERTLDDIPLTDLSAGDRRALLQQAVIMSWVDGEQHDKEVAFIGELCDKLKIPEEEAGQLTELATSRAKNLLELLSDDEEASE